MLVRCYTKRSDLRARMNTKTVIFIGLAMFASLSAFAGNINVKIVVDTQNIRLQSDIDTYLRAALAQFPDLLTVTSQDGEATLTVEPRSSGNTLFFDMILVGSNGKFCGNTTGVCQGSESAMRQTFKQAVVSMVRNGSFDAVNN
jgi:hypothetical protein